MPSFTFVSTANAFVLRGATPVFVDIRPDTLNIDETQDRGGDHRRGRRRSCPSTTPASAARWTRSWRSPSAPRPAGHRGRRARPARRLQAAGRSARSGTSRRCRSTRRRTSSAGEGGALLVNDERFVERAEIIREKGTNRSQFFRGQVDKYTWVDVGSSYLPGEIVAAFLWAQLEEADAITERRPRDLGSLPRAFEELEAGGLVAPADRPARLRPQRAHVLPAPAATSPPAAAFIERLKGDGINPVFHYVPLHSSPFGRVRRAGVRRALPDTDALSERLVRLPLWLGLEPDQDVVIEAVRAAARAVAAERLAGVSEG